jgi:hypothetical protein
MGPSTRGVFIGLLVIILACAAILVVLTRMDMHTNRAVSISTRLNFSAVRRTDYMTATPTPSPSLCLVSYWLKRSPVLLVVAGAAVFTIAAALLVSNGERLRADLFKYEEANCAG